jgi:hypothetical protein
LTLREFLAAVLNRPWEKISVASFAAGESALGLLVLILLRSESGFVPVLDHANLAFHEAGHIFFGFFGSTMELYGGTLGQLFFPVVAAGSFWWRRQPISFALSGAWSFENFFNIARYMADARARMLPLVGGGGHDWANIFTRWNAIENDTQIAKVTGILGWLGIAACAGWVLWRFMQDRREDSESR